jgi:hypothetical protein
MCLAGECRVKLTPSLYAQFKKLKVLCVRVWCMHVMHCDVHALTYNVRTLDIARFHVATASVRFPTTISTANI